MKRILFAALTAAALFSDGILQSLNAQNMEIPKKVSPFPVGDKLPEQFSKYFIGQAWLAPLTDDKRLNAPVSNVTFSPGCRNNWHSHTGGQLLIAVGGRGYYQEKGRPARALLPGDIVEIAPDVVHWHGAAPDSWFSHLAVACNPATNENTWLEPVDDAQYAAATASVPAPVSRLGEDARRRLAELFPGGISELGDADPELFEIFNNFTVNLELDNVIPTRRLRNYPSYPILRKQTLRSRSTRQIPPRPLHRQSQFRGPDIPPPSFL